MNTFGKIAGALGLVAVCAALGFLIFTSIKYYNAYTLSDKMLQQAFFSLSSTITTYGTIRSFDTETAVLEIEVLNRYISNGAPIMLRFPILPSAFIARQELSGPQGAYASVSTTTPLIGKDRFQGLVPGTRIKYIVLNRDPAGDAIIYLLVGDPL